MKQKQSRQQKRTRRHARVRAKIKGTAMRPRLAVFRSLSTIYAQLIDDTAQKTLVSVYGKKVTKKETDERKGKVAVAYGVGNELAAKAKELKITEVVFDRGGFLYSGRVKAVAEGAHDGGLQF